MAKPNRFARNEIHVSHSSRFSLSGDGTTINLCQTTLSHEKNTVNQMNKVFCFGHTTHASVQALMDTTGTSETTTTTTTSETTTTTTTTTTSATTAATTTDSTGTTSECGERVNPQRAHALTHAQHEMRRCRCRCRVSRRSSKRTAQSNWWHRRRLRSSLERRCVFFFLCAALAHCCLGVDRSCFWKCSFLDALNKRTLTAGKC